tara:strand:- start:23986 stop:24705 length:720 start_codon:yes stop_codon:yes gene_type:complete
MRAIILAAGRGSRLNNITKDKPKCLVEINKKTLLERQIDTFKKSNIIKISIVKGYLHEKIINKDITKEFFNDSWMDTNMVYSLTKASKWLNESDNIISYGDIFYSKKILNNLIEEKNDIVISYDHNYKYLWEKRFENPLIDLETFVIDENGFLLEVGNKPKNYEKINGQYMGLLKITKIGWLKIKSILDELDYKNMDMTTLLNTLIKRNIKIKAIKNVGIWGEIDTEEDIKVYEETHEI